MALQPRLGQVALAAGERQAHGGLPLFASVFATGIYGGYFGAAQGVILVSLLAIFIDDDLQRLNGVKNLLALVERRGGAAVRRGEPRRLGGGGADRRRLGGWRPARGDRRAPVFCGALRFIVVIGGLGVAGLLFDKYW